VSESGTLTPIYTHSLPTHSLTPTPILRLPYVSLANNIGVGNGKFDPDEWVNSGGCISDTKFTTVVYHLSGQGGGLGGSTTSANIPMHVHEVEDECASAADTLPP